MKTETETLTYHVWIVFSCHNNNHADNNRILTSTVQHLQTTINLINLTVSKYITDFSNISMQGVFFSHFINIGPCGLAYMLCHIYRLRFLLCLWQSSVQPPDVNSTQLWTFKTPGQTACPQYHCLIMSAATSAPSLYHHQHKYHSAISTSKADD